MTCDIDPSLIEEVEFTSDLKVELIDYLGSDAEIARAAWVSTKGERAEEEDPKRVKGLINMLMRDRHGSPFEQGLLRFRITVPMVVVWEHVRHRIASYNIYSGRYTEMRPVFYVPSYERPLIQIGKPGAYTFEAGSQNQHAIVESTFKRMGYRGWTEYKHLLNNGVAKEVSRLILPFTAMTTMIVAMNPRSLMNFLSLRVDSEQARYPTFPMWEIHQVAQQYENHFKELFPNTWESFVNNGRVAP